MVRPAFFALLSFCYAMVSVAHAQDLEKAEPLALLRLIDRGFTQVFERVAPTVVVIEATKKPELDGEDEISGFMPGPPDDPRDSKKQGTPPWGKLPAPPSRSEGSGFIIRPDGFLLTNLHVVNEADKLNVRLKDGRIFPARLVGSDDKTDIAVLKIEARDLPAVDFGDSDELRVGQLVCAIGAPYNQEYSFTCGWVSGKGRTNLLAPTSPTILYEDYIQTDAFINPGNSGGPLFDVEGKVIGMNTLINGIGRGLAFAIPANILQQISGQLIATGKVVRPWLGVRIESLAQNAPLKERVVGIEHGVVVLTVEANAPAFKSDLRGADIVTEIDGVKLETAHDFQKEILKKRVGQSVRLTVWRNGQILHLPVLTGELPAEITRVANATPKRGSVEAKGEAFGIKVRDGRPGAVVVDVLPGSPAAQSDIMMEDIITDVEDKPVTDAVSCLAALNAAEERGAKRGILLNIERKGRRTFVVLNPQK